MAYIKPIIISDLDETIISRVALPNDEIHLNINMKMLDIFHRAMVLRKKNRVDAILLLTNNTNLPVKSNGVQQYFLDLVNDRLVEEYNKAYAPDHINTMNDIFDMIYTAQLNVPRGIRNRTYNIVKSLPKKGYAAVNYAPGPNMSGLRFRAAKNIDIVKKMIKNIPRQISLENLEQRIYFFDDELIEHVIKAELESKGGSYITITPPFDEGEDKTDFTPIYTVLEKLEKKGGYRRTIKRRTLRS